MKFTFELELGNGMKTSEDVIAKLTSTLRKYTFAQGLLPAGSFGAIRFGTEQRIVGKWEVSE